MITKKISKRGTIVASLAVIIFLAGLFFVFNPAEALAFSCSRTIPDNGTMYANDNAGLTANTPYTYSGTNTDAKCEYACNADYKFVTSMAGSYCQSTCNSGTPCDTPNADGTKFCRSLNGGPYEWVTLYSNNCNFCQTYKCGTGTGSPQRGYCGIDSSENVGWVNSGSASCPYSISVKRNQSAYQLTASCAANNTGCQTASVSVSVSGGPNNVAVANSLRFSRIVTKTNHPGLICIPPVLNQTMKDTYPTWQLSGSTFIWHYWKDNGLTIPIDRDFCQTACSGESGDYYDIYHIFSFFEASNAYSIDCTPPTTIIPPAYVCTPGQWDAVNCRACNASGQWTDNCTDWGTGADVPAWCACELKCTGKNVNPSCIAPPITPPSTPTISASCPSPGTAGHVEWSASAGATYYAFRLNNYTLPGGWNDACQPAYEGDICENINAPSISRDFEGSPGSFYDAWVHACNSAGCSPAVAVQGFSCLQPLPPCQCNNNAGESCTFPSQPCIFGNAINKSESGGQFHWECSDAATCTDTATGCHSDKGNPDVPVSSCTNLDTISCSKSCGGGTKTETCQNHDCSSTTRSISCNSQSCPPGYKEVTPW